MSANHAILVQVTNTTRLFIADSVSNTAERDGLKYSQTTKTRVPLPYVDDDGERTQMTSVPVINANLLRGRLRRNIADRIMDSLRARGLGVSVDTIHLLTCLASSGSPSSAKNVANAMQAKDPAKFFKSKEADPKGDEFKATDFRTEYLTAQTSDPFVALFGGGPNMWRSRLVTPDLMPNITALQQPGLINSRYNDAFEGETLTVYPSSLVELVGTVRNDDVFRNTKHQDPDADDVKTWIAIEADNSNKEESKTNLKNMMIVEVVRSGVPFIGELMIRNQDVSEKIFSVMKGLVLLALDDLKTQQLGGQVRNGWGFVNVEIAKGEDQDCIDQATAYIENVTVSDLMEAFGVAFR